VITHEDIRRSGMTTLPDLLRLAPGVDVAAVNANNWAVSVRGFNGSYANKLLVLVDGRSVYNRIFSGVLWDAEDLMVDDIDRIEVIRGPGAAIWGANAVTGVINIVTKPPADTQGGLVRVDGGRADEQVAIRYGGTRGALRYRLYSQWTRRNESLLTPGTSANDASHSATTGFRTDWTRQADAFVLEGHFTAGQARALWSNLDPQTTAGAPIANEPSDTHGGYVLGRWTHTRASGASLQIQSFTDFSGRQEPVATYHQHTFDLDTQYHTPFGAHQDVVFGSGVRIYDDRYEGGVGFSLVPANDRSSLVSAFVQDEVALFANRLAITLGSQVQHDSNSGAGLQPTARIIWKGLARHRFWAATSRALRTPSRYEQGIAVDLPPVPTASGLPVVATVLGNPLFETETFIATEGGYRLELGATASIDATVFRGRYEHLRTTEPSAPTVQFVPTPEIHVTSEFSNQLSATTRGLEVAGHWSPMPRWRFDAMYSAFRIRPQLAAGSQDPLAATEDGSAPRTQWQVRGTFQPSPRATLNAALLHVGPLEQFQVDAYTRADISAEWRFSSRFALSAIGQNLFDAAHFEFSSVGGLRLATQVPRTASLRLRWTFR
jgi:iron complex outermembrane receptor protein